jgi:hypothetical protein
VTLVGFFAEKAPVKTTIMRVTYCCISRKTGENFYDDSPWVCGYKIFY